MCQEGGSPSERYRRRSWSRLGRPCQNSHSNGTRRQPPQCAGPGDLRVGELLVEPRDALVEHDRSAITSLCGDAHAPSWLPRGREAKYASLSSTATRSTRARDADLAVQVEPGEHRSRDRRVVELTALGTLVVRVEHEPALVGGTGQHDAGIGNPIRTDRGDRHRVRFGDARVERLVVPPLPLLHRFGCEVVDVEPGRLVLHAAVAEHVGPRGNARQIDVAHRVQPVGSIRVDAAHVRVQRLGHGDRPVGIAVVLDDRRPHAGHGERRPVEGVHELGALERFAVGVVAAEADVGRVAPGSRRTS